jgi:hypothetical protein
MSDLAAPRPHWSPARSLWQDTSSSASGLALAVLLIAVFGALATLLAVGLLGQ